MPEAVIFGVVFTGPYTLVVNKGCLYPTLPVPRLELLIGRRIRTLITNKRPVSRHPRALSGPKSFILRLWYGSTESHAIENGHSEISPGEAIISACSAKSTRCDWISQETTMCEPIIVSFSGVLCGKLASEMYPENAHPRDVGWSIAGFLSAVQYKDILNSLARWRANLVTQTW